jgi:hypothetical protein
MRLGPGSGGAPTHRIARGALVVAFALVAGACATTAGSTTVPSASPTGLASPTAQASPSPTSPPTSAASAPTSSVVPTPTPAPVVLDATAVTQGTVKGGTLAFVAKDGGAGTCQSWPDARRVESVYSSDVGKLGSGTIRARLAIPMSGSGVTTAELWNDGANIPEGAFQPFWTGPARITESGAGGMTGTMTFGALKLDVDAILKPGQSAPAEAADWPATLSGTISWTCGPWATPASSGAPPASIAP